MTSSSFQREDLMPKSSDGISRGMALAAVVHVGLLIALTLGVSWKSNEPEGVEAELWAAVPQIAAQRDVAPEPPKPEPKPKVEPKPEPKPPEPKVERPDPQIAIEKAKQEKLKKKQEEDKREREEKEKLDKKKAADEKAKLAKADAERQKKLDDARDKNLARIKDMMGEKDGSPGGKAAQTAGPSASWGGRVIARVKPNFVFTEPISGDPTVEVELKLGSDGTITGRKLVKSSGDSRLDDAILRALDKTETLPRDTDGTVPPSGTIVFRPKSL
ncbi:MAG: cell envelope integrity protein TolA [Rhizobacter sp.]